MEKNNGKAEVEDLVRRFRVCWEVSREQALVDGKIRDIGFALDLFGTHEPDTPHVAPGCEHCKPVQAGLRQIAEWILPREERPSMYEISIEGQSLVYSSHRRNRPDVRLTIRILHRSGFEHPIDPCEVRCLTEMEQALSDLGASRSKWEPATRKPKAPSRPMTGSGS